MSDRRGVPDEEKRRRDGVPAEVVASAFANRRFRLVLANHGRAPAEIATAEAWLRDDAPGPAATRFTLPPRSLAILERPVGV